MKLRNKVVLAVSSIIIIVLIGALVDLYYKWSYPPCTDQLQRMVPSPEGDKVAIAYIRDCGATTTFSLQLEIADTPNRNVNDAKKNYDNIVVSIRGFDKAYEMEWKDNRNVALVTSLKPSDVELFKEELNAAHVTIDFREPLGQ